MTYNKTFSGTEPHTWTLSLIKVKVWDTTLKEVACWIYPIDGCWYTNMQISRNVDCETLDYEEPGLNLSPINDLEGCYEHLSDYVNLLRVNWTTKQSVLCSVTNTMFKGFSLINSSAKGFSSRSFRTHDATASWTGSVWSGFYTLHILFPSACE